MYKRDSDSWLKHWDFILLDLLCLQAAFVLAYAISGYGFFPYDLPLYRNMAIFLVVADFLTIIFTGTMRDVLKRGYYNEFTKTFQTGFIVGAVSILYLFLIQEGQNFSRMTLLLTFVIYVPLTYGVRTLWKRLLLRKMRRGGDRSLLVVSTAGSIRKVLASLKENNYARYRIVGAVVIDRDAVGRTIDGVPVVANRDTIGHYLVQEWVDEALVIVPDSLEFPRDLIDAIAETGVVVHYNLARHLFLPDHEQFIENVGPFTVVTTSMNYATSMQLFMKRAIDIIGGLVGCVATGVIFIFIAPVIYAKSPGPIFYSQERVGRNGRRFKMYKFRSMRTDADDLKAELMAQNKVNDERMFKMDFDPRVIGNVTLPDGTQKRGIGDFIRRTSLDEFPQFFNVLKGDMSIVGTRPPLVSEANLYESHHRARLAIKPGITGLWQVSGRSDITDFEEVVRLDREYISNWSNHLDLKILLKTIVIVAKGKGSI